MIRKFIQRSRKLKIIKKLSDKGFIRGGSTVPNHDQYMSDDEFFRSVIDVDKGSYTQCDQINIAQHNDISRMNNEELRKFLSNRSKRLTRNQKLIRSMIRESQVDRTLSQIDFQNLEDMYVFRRKYKNYLRLKRFFPICMIAPFTSNELSKMAIASAIGSKSVSLTLPGLIGYSLPAFFFFHMSQFYLPDKFKSVCQLGKYVIGAPFWVMCSITDELASNFEEPLFGEEIPIDIMNTGGTIPNDIGDLNDLKSLVKEMTELSQEFTKKTY